MSIGAVRIAESKSRQFLTMQSTHIRPWPVIAVLIMSLSAAASAHAGKAKISPFAASDHRFMAHQLQLVEELAARHYGRRISGDKRRDLETLQRLLDDRHVRKGNTLMFQAMGVVMGNLMAAEHKLNWVIYKDELGRSRALRLDQSEIVLFPITIISRRVDAGIRVNVAELYEKAIEKIRPALARRYHRSKI